MTQDQIKKLPNGRVVVVRDDTPRTSAARDIIEFLKDGVRRTPLELRRLLGYDLHTILVALANLKYSNQVQHKSPFYWIERPKE